MRLGVHVRMERGLLSSLDRAEQLSCETIQLFSGNPSGWARRPLDPVEAGKFAARAAALDIHPIILHTPYLVNLASPDDDIWRKSTVVLADAVSRAPMLGGDRIVTHIGSHKGSGYECGVARVAESVKIALQAHPLPMIALELGSGSGNSIGSRFEQISDILVALGNAAGRVGIRIDTAHLWAAGYDISTENGVDYLFEELDRWVGQGKLLMVHLNDTQMALGCHRDRHYHIAQGCIGSEGFDAIVNHPCTKKVPGIIETPGHDLEHDMANLATLRSFQFPRRKGGGHG